MPLGTLCNPLHVTRNGAPARRQLELPITSATSVAKTIMTNISVKKATTGRVVGPSREFVHAHHGQE